jgi:hypothetical protein
MGKDYHGHLILNYHQYRKEMMMKKKKKKKK